MHEIVILILFYFILNKVSEHELNELEAKKPGSLTPYLLLFALCFHSVIQLINQIILF